MTFLTGLIVVPSSSASPNAAISAPPNPDSEIIEEDICMLGLNVLSTLVERFGKTMNQYEPLLKIIKEDLCCNHLLRVSVCCFSSFMFVSFFL